MAALAVGGIALVALAALAMMYRAVTGERDYLRVELEVARGQLLHAWREGATIPPRALVEPKKDAAPAPPAAPPNPNHGIPETLLPFVTRWESEAGREAARAELRQMLAEGMSEPEIVHTLDRREMEPEY